MGRRSKYAKHICASLYQAYMEFNASDSSALLLLSMQHVSPAQNHQKRDLTVAGPTLSLGNHDKSKRRLG